MDKKDLQAIIDTIDYKDGFSFRVEDEFIQLQEMTTCNRSGEPYHSRGRKWKWSKFMTKSEVVTTCLKACLQYEEHEARENFKYRGLSIFDPHYDVDRLFDLRSESGWDDVREEH